MRTARRLLRNETGSTAIEYALVASLIAVVIAVSVASIGSTLKPIFNTIGNAL